MRRIVLVAGLVIAYSTGVFAESDAVRKWWISLNDPLINRYAERVLLENLDVQTATARVQSARSAAEVPRASWWPDISLAASTSRGNMASVKDASISRIGVQGTWTLDLFGSNGATVKMADARVDDRLAALDQARRDVVSELVSAVVSWRESRMVRQLIREQLAEVDTQIVLQMDLASAGLSDQTKLIPLQVQRSKLEAALPSVEAAVTLAIVKVDELLGATDNSVVTEMSEADSLQIKLPSFDAVLGTDVAAIQNRPDVLGARSLVVAADANLSKAEAAVWPEVTLKGFYGVQDVTDGVFQTGTHIWSVSADVNYPLFNFGRLQNSIDSQDAEKRAAASQYQSVVKSALAQTRSSVAHYVSEMSAVTAMQSAERTHRTGLVLARDQYEAGLTSYIPYSVAQVDYLQTRINATRQYKRAAQAYINLQASVGAGL